MYRCISVLGLCTTYVFNCGLVLGNVFLDPEWLVILSLRHSPSAHVCVCVCVYTQPFCCVSVGSSASTRNALFSMQAQGLCTTCISTHTHTHMCCAMQYRSSWAVSECVCIYCGGSCFAAQCVPKSFQARQGQCFSLGELLCAVGGRATLAVLCLL